MCCRFRDMRSCQCTVLTIAILHEYTSGQGKHGCPQFGPLSEVASATRCGLLACRPHCVPTQLWPSQGSSRNLPSWLRFQVRLSAASGNLCQVYCVTCQASKSVRFLLQLSCSQRLRDLHFMRCQRQKIVMWYIFKTVPQPNQTVYAV